MSSRTFSLWNWPIWQFNWVRNWKHILWLEYNSILWEWGWFLFCKISPWSAVIIRWACHFIFFVYISNIVHVQLFGSPCKLIIKKNTTIWFCCLILHFYILESFVYCTAKPPFVMCRKSIKEELFALSESLPCTIIIKLKRAKICIEINLWLHKRSKCPSVYCTMQ